MGKEGEWHPISLSESVESGTSAGVQLLGRELVVWRDSAGAAHTWEDRCPHRGMRLSFGFVRNDRIACLYHGWQYDTGGQCRYIPAHPDLVVPETIKVPVYAVREQYGMIWTALEGDPALPFRSEDSDGTVPVRSLYLDCSSNSALDALRTASLDPFQQSMVAEAQFRALGGNLYALSNGAHTLVIGIQTISETRTALHIAISGSAKRYAGAGQLHFLRWANDLRGRALKPAASNLHTAAQLSAGAR